MFPFLNSVYTTYTFRENAPQTQDESNKTCGKHFFKQFLNKTRRTTQPMVNEIDRYLSTPCLTDDVDILELWVNHATELPVQSNLFIMALFIMTIIL